MGALDAGAECDLGFMELALSLARQSEVEEEVPVGAVLVLGGEVVGKGRNRPIHSHDPTAHAEIEALRSAAAQVGNYRLLGSTLFVTLEPCVMCVGAMIVARISRLVFAARDIRFGAVRSKFQLADSELLNHRVLVDEGLCGSESAEMLARFFQLRRKGALVRPLS